MIYTLTTYAVDENDEIIGTDRTDEYEDFGLMLCKLVFLGIVASDDYLISEQRAQQQCEDVGVWYGYVYQLEITP